MDKAYKESYRKLGLNIAFYRKDRGLTQMQLAELLDIDRNRTGNGRRFFRCNLQDVQYFKCLSKRFIRFSHLNEKDVPQMRHVFFIRLKFSPFCNATKNSSHYRAVHTQ